MNAISIRDAGVEDVPLLYALYDTIGKKDDGYFEQLFEEDTKILMAECDGAVCGFCLFNERPRYSLYRTLGIPEIQDLNVIPAYRRRGIATALIKWCEGLARAKGCEQIGIAVGLFKEYGPAQILYATLGYLPDGNGATYDREGVTPYTPYMMDDDLSLMLVKSI